ncbi:aminoglycoside phosphotransferase family protein [Kribbella catacumbae]|uniref:aminoglycoside phosphotransferase family protein n=1 Tax=Kribbella catacumbae TaxID=460086 RepID=UPI0003765775|nr:aminoglycoside phosphotransferase family protein [Kribbella catacumbae]
MEPPIEYFEQHAAGPVALIGQGMEGAVYDLGNGLVGKVWFNRTAAEVLPVQAFLAELNQQDLPFRTPDITVVDTVDGQAVSIERKLTGTPLSEALETGAVTQEQGLDLFVDVVTALSKTTAGPASKALPLLGETSAQGEWGDALAELVRQRALKSCEYLAADVDGFDNLLQQVLANLSAVRLERPQIVHGDICTPNLLVDDDQVALLDWGFVTTAGDNTFDASTAAAFYDMYSPAARAIDDQLVDRFEVIGHSRDRMYLYRAAYAIATATIYSPTAADGHYTWCVENLRRKELRAAL